MIVTCLLDEAEDGIRLKISDTFMLNWSKDTKVVFYDSFLHATRLISL